MRLTSADKQVIRAFLNREPGEKTSKKLQTDGTKLDGLWMGGDRIAEWKAGKLHFRGYDSRSQQAVAKAVVKEAPPKWMERVIHPESMWALPRKKNAQRMYRVIAIRETPGSDAYPPGSKTYMADTDRSPVTHREATTILRKMTPYRHLRYQLEEVGDEGRRYTPAAGYGSRKRNTTMPKKNAQHKEKNARLSPMDYTIRKRGGVFEVGTGAPRTFVRLSTGWLTHGEAFEAAFEDALDRRLRRRRVWLDEGDYFELLGEVGTGVRRDTPATARPGDARSSIVRKNEGRGVDLDRHPGPVTGDYVITPRGNRFRLTREGLTGTVGSSSSLEGAIKLASDDARFQGEIQLPVWYMHGGRMKKISDVPVRASTRKRNEGTVQKNSRDTRDLTPYEAMAWSNDPVTRAIYGEVDDRDLAEIAESVMEIWEESGDQHGKANRGRLSKEQHDEANTLASRIVDWANYGLAYGDFTDPPWEEYIVETNPRRKKNARRARGTTAARYKQPRAGDYTVDFNEVHQLWWARKRGVGALNARGYETMEEAVDRAHREAVQRGERAKPVFIDRGDEGWEVIAEVPLKRGRNAPYSTVEIKGTRRVDAVPIRKLKNRLMR